MEASDRDGASEPSKEQDRAAQPSIQDPHDISESVVAPDSSALQAADPPDAVPQQGKIRNHAIKIFTALRKAFQQTPMLHYFSV